ncbi:SDR family NAD(P)-dependent oxidoreductase [Spirosoma spitsbergense]|uniref:SDR family NAD(P)-dependent oxidoreductase n=1 Tax=Spirosoma spitsbergense TaxID=431554 RepID=UPI00035F9428|nr:SDR family NAD(P)-dependent oxidoreductase [Spirosoma spitsbergense]
METPASILVTGAAGHLGTSVVHELHQLGYRVLAVVGSKKDISIFEHLERVTSYAVDLLDPSGVADFMDTIRPQSPRAAVLLVGGFTAGGFAETNVEALEAMFRLNFLTAYNMVQPMLPVFDARGGGQFILVGAKPALMPDVGKGLVAYSLSKSLVFDLAQLINAYGQGKAISATVIVPGTIDTPPNRKAMPDVDPAIWVTPEAIGKTIAFVLSDTGQMMREPILKLYNRS